MWLHFAGAIPIATTSMPAALMPDPILGTRHSSFEETFRLSHCKGKRTEAFLGLYGQQLRCYSGTSAHTIWL